MKRDQIGGLQKYLVAGYFLVCIMVGIVVGITIPFIALCTIAGVPVRFDQPVIDMPINQPALLVLIFIGLWLGVLEIAFPLLFLGLKPFYTRQALLNTPFKLKNERQARERLQRQNSLQLFAIDRASNYWFNLIFPPGKDQNT